MKYFTMSAMMAMVFNIVIKGYDLALRTFGWLQLPREHELVFEMQSTGITMLSLQLTIWFYFFQEMAQYMKNYI